MNLCVTINPDTIWYRGNNLTAVGYSITAWLVQAVKYEYRDYFTKKRAFEDNPFWEYPVPKWVRDKWDSWDYCCLMAVQELVALNGYNIPLYFSWPVDVVENVKTLPFRIPC